METPLFSAGTPASGPRSDPPRVAGYDVVRRLGAGGSAEVWLVEDQRSGGRFALKVAHPPGGGPSVVPGSGSGPSVVPGSGGGSGADEQTGRELALLDRLRHEHLIRVHAVVPTDRGRGLLMDYLPGGSLGALLAARGPLTVGEVVTVLTPLAQVLEYLHGQGVVHGDLAPGNVLFTSSGKPVLTDLGLGRMHGLGVPASGTAGTTGFTDPAATSRRGGARAGEADGHSWAGGPTGSGGLSAAGGPGPASDVYALAAIGWFVLTGRVPGRTEQRPPLAVLVPGVPRELVMPIEAGLSEEPFRRPSPGEFSRAVFRSASAAPLSLAAAVHAEVLPELLTRRVVDADGRQARQARGSGVPGGGLLRRAASWLRCALGKGAGRASTQPVPGVPARGPHRRLGWQEDAARNGSRHGSSRRGPALQVSSRGTGLSGQVPRRSGPRHLAGAGESAVARTAAAQTTVPAAAAGTTPAGTAPAGAGQAGPQYRLPATLAAACAVLVGITLWLIQPAGGPQPELPPAASADPVTASPETVGPDVRDGARAGAAAPGPASGPGAGESLTGPDPAAAVPALAALRTQAFLAADVGLLAGVNVPGSPAMAADTASINDLLSRGHRLVGLQMDAVPAPAATSAGPRATVPVTVQASAFEERDAAGNVLSRSPPSGPLELRLVLQRTDGRWLIAEVLPAVP